jgi:nitroreductase
VDRHLIRDFAQRKALDRLAQQQQVRQAVARGAARGVGERVGGGVETDGEGVAPRARYVERIAPVSRSGVDGRTRERAGDLGDLTDVDVEEAFTDELTHGTMLALPRGVHCLVGVLHQALRAGDRARDVEAAVEAAEILGGLESLLERGFGQAQRGAEPLELALIDVARSHDGRMLASAPMIEVVRTVRQIRQYASEAVPEDVVKHLLEIARWTGSSRNSQPWHFIVVNDKEQLRQISQLRAPINWLASAPLGIAIVLDGKGSVSEAYDEGRVTERILIAAHALGYGGGVAWYGDDAQQAEAKRILGIPPERTARSIVMIGRPISTQDPRPSPRKGGRKPLSEVVSYGRWGTRT